MIMGEVKNLLLLIDNPIHKKEVEANLPVQVPNPKHLSCLASNGVTAPNPFNRDSHRPDIRRHGVITDTGDNDNKDGKVVEDAIRPRRLIQQAEEDKQRQEVDGRHSPQPVTTTSSDVDVSWRRIVFEDVISCDECCQGRRHFLFW